MEISAQSYGRKLLFLSCTKNETSNCGIGTIHYRLSWPTEGPFAFDHINSHKLVIACPKHVRK